jgi:ABC-type bacteriocin/lantibiotic exporter with double-glycine peptidase domain
MKCREFVVPEREVPGLSSRTELPISNELLSASLYVTIAAGFVYLLNFINWFLITANHYSFYIITIGAILLLVLAILIARRSFKRKLNKSKVGNGSMPLATSAHQETLRKIDAWSTSLKGHNTGQEDTKPRNWSNDASQFNDILFNLTFRRRKSANSSARPL